MPELVPADVLDEMIAYYGARAAEYDEWWDRRGRYDRGVELNDRWCREREQVYAAFDTAAFSGHVLELAPGTGIWTRRLASVAASVTAIDASPEMLLVNAANVPAGNVRRIVGDLFQWSPDEAYDGVLFGFWISHVPNDRLPGFLRSVAAALRPGGKLFFLDGLREPASTAVDHVLPSESEEVMTRRLNDGSEYRIVKTFHELDHLAKLCRSVGLEIDIRSTPTYFYYGVGTRVPEPS